MGVSGRRSEIYVEWRYIPHTRNWSLYSHVEWESPIIIVDSSLHSWVSGAEIRPLPHHPFISHTQGVVSLNSPYYLVPSFPLTETRIRQSGKGTSTCDIVSIDRYRNLIEGTDLPLREPRQSADQEGQVGHVPLQPCRMELMEQLISILLLQLLLLL